jgi:hypothetical protein
MPRHRLSLNHVVNNGWPLALMLDTEEHTQDASGGRAG